MTNTTRTHSPKTVRLDVNNCSNEDFLKLQYTIASTAWCDCGQRFLVEAKLPTEMLDDQEFIAKFNGRLCDIAGQRRDAHIYRATLK